jgi:hypothetical protein
MVILLMACWRRVAVRAPYVEGIAEIRHVMDGPETVRDLTELVC